MADIKDNKTSYTVFDTNVAGSVFIGGGKSDAAGIVGQEFADITGGASINVSEILPLLTAVLTSKGWSDVPGLEGVRLVSISDTEFTLEIDGGGPSTDFITFRGDAVAGAIDALSGTMVDIKNSASQVAIFDTDTMSSIFIGGGKSDAQNLVGQEFADITGGTRIHTHEVDDLLSAVLSGSGANPAAHGLAGVTLRGLTDESFTLTMTAAAPTEDTIIFSGQAASDAIASVASSMVDIKNSATQIGVFDVATMGSIFIGGGKSDAIGIVGPEFGEITEGTRINTHEVLEIFAALTSGASWTDAGAHGLEGVELVGLDADSFAIALDTGGPATDYVLFTNVDHLAGAAAFGFDTLV